MTLAERLHRIIEEEADAMDRPATGKACPMDKDGRHRWQRPWAQWANQYIGNNRCACGAVPPSAVYPEV